MIIRIANFNGDSGKTSTPIHVAAFMQTLVQTILADGDIVGASLKWTQRGGAAGLPFKVVPVGQLAKHGANRAAIPGWPGGILDRLVHNAYRIEMRAIRCERIGASKADNRR
jgi:hypothetical protein